MDSVPWTVIFLQDCKHQSMQTNCVIVSLTLTEDAIQQERIKNVGPFFLFSAWRTLSHCLYWVFIL